jgi:hypothetical protein
LSSTTEIPPPLDEEPAAPTRLRWVDVLKPRHPVEAILLLAIGAGLALAVRAALTAHVTVAPWNVRADRVCLDAGDQYLASRGTPPQRLVARIRVSETALAQLRHIGHSVPAGLSGGYQTVLADKAHVIALLQQELPVARAGRPTTAVEAEIRDYTASVYSQDALALGLDVCGEGVGNQ